MNALEPIDDVLGPGVRLLLVGINPGRRSAETGCHFAGPGNRFWPALHAAGITDRVLAPSEQWLLPPLGVGVTNLVPRPSPRAADLDRAELVAGAARLRALVARTNPRVVAVLGLTAYRTAFGDPAARTGPQPAPLAGARLWLLPNPSGLNASTQLAGHAAGLAAAARAAAVGAAPPHAFPAT